MLHGFLQKKRWMIVSVLATKDQVVKAFAKFKAEAENTLGYKSEMCEIR
jgi:hypothetical protein